MIKAVVTGAGGRMGRRILALLAERSDISIGGAAEQSGHPLIGHDAGEGAGIGSLVGSLIGGAIGFGLDAPLRYGYADP